MYINVSRAMSFQLCKKKTFNRYHRMVEGARSMNLVDGSAFHQAIAVGLATGNWLDGLNQARPVFDEAVKTANILPEQSYLIEEHWNTITACVKVYAAAFAEQNIQVVQPECEFDVELPNSEHNCIFKHWIELGESGLPLMEHWNEQPSAEAIAADRVRSPHPVLDSTCQCWGPHRFCGKTDAIVLWQGPMWLLEHKTTAILGEQFWAQWRLHKQPTGYIYGIAKPLKIVPHGFIINALFRPSESQLANWNSKRKTGPDKKVADYVKYEREAFLRTPQDLQRFEAELIDLCNEWEWRIIHNKWPISDISGTCTKYNRLCDYHGACCDFDVSINDLAPCQPDYIQEKYAKPDAPIQPDQPMED